MNRKHLSVAVAVAAIFSASAFAQGAGVTSGTGVAVTSGTGIAVAPSAPLVAPAPAPRVYYGAAVVPYRTTTVMGGPAEGVTTRTVITRSWVNVPADVAAREDFQRWQSLK